MSTEEISKTEEVEKTVEPKTETEVIPTQETQSKTTSEENTSVLEDLGLVNDKKEEVKTEEVKTEEPKKEEAKIEEYEIEISKDSPITDEELDGIVALAEKYKWTKEETDKFIADKESMYSRGTEALKRQASEAIRLEKEKFLADPDFKGEKLKQSLAAMDVVVSKFGDDGLKQYLKGPGGNSLSLAKFLVKIGNLMQQDDIKGKGVNSGKAPTGSREEALSNMYPQFFSDN